MTLYADTIFFTRIYLQLDDTKVALQLFEKMRQENRQPVPVTWLHRIEFVNALQLHVFTSRQSGQTFISPEQAALAFANFRDDLKSQSFIRNAIVPVSELEKQFEELSLRYTARHGFRTYDLLHVASALALKCDTFWSFDPKAAKLAALEGLKIRRQK
jgi:predicted nucleic acid-binding protein